MARREEEKGFSQEAPSVPFTCWAFIGRDQRNSFQFSDWRYVHLQSLLPRFPHIFVFVSCFSTKVLAAELASLILSV
jgi:hypothetical protein